MKKKQQFITNIIFYGLIIAIFFAVCKFILPVLVPFIIAFLIASLIRIPIKKLYSTSLSRNKAISIVTCILFFSIVFFLLGIAGVKIYNTVFDFLMSIPAIYQDSIVPALGTMADMINNTLSNMDEGFAAEMNNIYWEYVNNIGEYIKTFSVNAIKVISGSLIEIPAFIIRLVITIISTFFFIIDYDKITTVLIKLIPKNRQNTVVDLITYYKSTILIYLKSYTLLFLLTYVELTIGFWILKIPYAPLIALLIAVFDILPILGVGGILLPWSVILFVMKDIPMGIGILVLYLIITFIRNVAEPKLVGKQIGLHPLATLIFMYLGLKLLGFLGMFLFPVTLAVYVNMKFDKTEEKDSSDTEKAPASDAADAP